jgi:hypothetical protein
MAGEDVHVDRQTVGLWVMRDDDDFTDKTVPGSLEAFRAFAHALRLPLTDSQIAFMYADINRWRVQHRLAGANVAKAMCAAAMGRLDATALEKLRNEWGGLDVSDLIEGTYLSTVDEVVNDESGDS